jgi:hypothetical protein
VRGKKSVSERMSEEDFNDIGAYLVKTAADESEAELLVDEARRARAAEIEKDEEIGRLRHVLGLVDTRNSRPYLEFYDSLIEDGDFYEVFPGAPKPRAALSDKDANA